MVNERTREEHLAWCKQRAHEYLAAGDPAQAIASMLSDLGKHPETAGLLSWAGMLAINMGGDVANARKFIDGFN